MSYFEFPHTRTYDGDLGFIIKRLEELTKKYDDFMRYNQIKFAPDIWWNIDKTYDAWNLVWVNLGDSSNQAYLYMSIKPVPYGIQYSNTDYWALVMPFVVDGSLDESSFNPVANAPVAQAISILNTQLQTESETRQTQNAQLVDTITNDRQHFNDITDGLADELDATNTIVAQQGAQLNSLTQTITPGSTSGDAELINIRTAFNGVTYSTAGDAVRAQTSMLNNRSNNINESTGTLDADVFNYGIVTASMTPSSDANNRFKYVIFDVDAIHSYMYAHTSTTYNVLKKVSLFNVSNQCIYTEANWSKVSDGDVICLNTYPTFPSAKYVGVTICYSTTTSIDNAVSNISLTDLFISANSNALNNTVIDNTNNIFAIMASFGDLCIHNFNYGYVVDSLTPTYTDSFGYRYVIVDLNNIGGDLYIHFDTNYHLFAYIAVFDGNGTRLFHSDSFTEFQNSSAVIRKSYSAFPTARYASLTYRYSTTSNIANTIFPLPELDSVYLLEDNKTLSDRIGEPIYTVATDGSGIFSSITDAINGTSDGDTIYLKNGTYNESVHMWGKNRHIIGESRESTIIFSGTGLYATPAMEANIGSLENLTIISGNDNELPEDSTSAKAYGIHIEHAEESDHTFVVRNCTIVSYLGPAVGIGCRHNQKIVFEGCSFETKATIVYSSYYSDFISSGAVLFHNDAEAVGATDTGSLEFNDCIMIGKSRAIMCQSMENGNKMVVLFNKCLAYIDNDSTTNVFGYWGSSTKGVAPYLVGTDVILRSLSYGNNSIELNYDDYWN